MDIKTRLRANSLTTPTATTDPGALAIIELIRRDYADALAEIERLERCVETWLRASEEFESTLGFYKAQSERLESEVSAERHARAHERQEYDSVIRAMRQQLDTMTDRLLTAGLMS